MAKSVANYEKHNDKVLHISFWDGKPTYELLVEALDNLKKDGVDLSVDWFKRFTSLRWIVLMTDYVDKKGNKWEDVSVTGYDKVTWEGDSKEIEKEYIAYMKKFLIKSNVKNWKDLFE